jgi:hypothetical protein
LQAKDFLFIIRNTFRVQFIKEVDLSNNLFGFQLNNNKSFFLRLKHNSTTLCNVTNNLLLIFTYQ